MSKKYFYDMGKCYDTSFFLTLYFNEEVFFGRVRNRFNKVVDVNEAMQGFFRFKEQYNSFVVSSEIAPFVYTNYEAGLRSFLILEPCGLAFEDNTLDGIVAFLRSPKFKIAFWEHYFPSKKSTIAEQICNNDKTLNIPDALGSLTISSDIKIQLIDMAHDFPKYQRKLINTFNEAYVLVDEYYTENQCIIEEMKSKVDDNFIDRLCKIHKLPSSILSPPIYFSLFNELLLDYRSADNKVCFGFGKHIDDVIAGTLRYDHISLNSFGKITHVESRAEMLDMFFKYKKLCAADFAHKLNLSQSAIYLHLNLMIYEGIIQHTDSKPKGHGERVFLSINPNYFEAFATLSLDFAQKAHDNISKGIDRYDRPRKKRKAKDGLIYKDSYNEDDIG